MKQNLHDLIIQLVTDPTPRLDAAACYQRITGPPPRRQPLTPQQVVLLSAYQTIACEPPTFPGGPSNPDEAWQILETQRWLDDGTFTEEASRLLLSAYDSIEDSLLHTYRDRRWIAE